MDRKNINGSILNGAKETIPPIPETPIQQTEETCSIFVNSLISMWIEDFSEVKRHIDSLQHGGVTDFKAYFDNHPEEVAYCASRVKIVDINEATLKLYKVKSKEEFKNGLKNIFCEESYEVFKEELICLAKGNIVFERECLNKTFSGEKININLKWSVSRGYEKTLSRVIVSIVDITALKRIEEELRNLARFTAENPNPVMRISNNGILLYANKKGFSILEDLDCKINERVTESWLKIVSEAMQTGFTKAVEIKHGETVYSFVVVPIVSSGYVNLYGRDITEEKRVEEVLVESENRYRMLAESAHDYIFIVDREFCIKYANTYAAKQLGLSPKELMNKQLKEFFPPGLFERYKRNLQTVFDGGKSISVEEKSEFLNRTVWLNTTLVPLTNGASDVHAVLGISRDITEYKKVEQALYESEVRFRSLTENSIEGIGMSKGNRVIYANRTLLDIFGYDSMEEFIKIPLIEHVAPESRDMIVERMDKKEKGIPVDARFEYKIIRKNGDIRDIEISTSEVCIENERYVQSTLRDVTELKKIENDLRERKSFLSNIFESIQDGISILDKEMNIIQVNPVMKKWYAHAEPLEGKKCYEAYHSADKPCDICPSRKTIKTSAAAYEIVPKRGKNGGIVGWFDLYSFPLLDTVTGELKGVIEYVRDITERKQAEEAIVKERQRYEGLVNNINVGIYRTTPGMEGIFIEVNPAFVSMFDAGSREDLIGRKVKDVYQDMADSAKLSDKLLKFGYIKDEKFQLKSLNGRIFWGSVTAVAIRDDKGNDYFDGIVEDITERKHSEEILNYRIEFEKLISSISTSFINIPIDEIDNDINLALKRIGEFASVDRSYVFLTYDNATKADETHEWCASGVQSELSKLQGLSEKDFPWFAKKIKSSEYLYIPSLESLPQEAASIKKLLQSSGVKSMICVPMFYSGQPMGFLGFDSIREKRIWTDESIALLKITGEIFANAIERKRAQKRLEKLNRELSLSNKKLKQMSLIDFSSGLFNHRYLMEIIESEFYRARRSAHALSAIKTDVDYFKSINDTYGHQFGDLVLKQLAGTLKQMVRQYDIVVRFGGEEFVIISPGTNKPTAIILAQRILDAINLLNFGTKKYAVKLKLSMAVASYPDDRIIKGTDLIELTEKILNRGKEYGGNRVYSSEDIKASKPAASKKATAESEVKYLKEKIEKLTRRASQSLIESVFAFARTIELKDHYTGQHTEKTVKYATEVAKELKLPKEDVELIRQASILHDLGKIGISEKILRKKSKLTAKEFRELKKHPQIGADVIRPVQLLHNIIPLMLHHHERWDGKGYPGGLKRDEIPLGARIVAIADVFQALTSNRPYRKAYSKAEAIQIIKGNAGNQFDPEVVNAFLRVLKQ